MRTFLALAIAFNSVSLASACINDRELPSHEREFRSQYQEAEFQPVSVEPETSYVTKFLLGGAAGAGIALAAVGSLVLLRWRNTQQ